MGGALQLRILLRFASRLSGVTRVKLTCGLPVYTKDMWRAALMLGHNKFHSKALGLGTSSFWRYYLKVVASEVKSCQVVVHLHGLISAMPKSYSADLRWRAVWQHLVRGLSYAENW